MPAHLIAKNVMQDIFQVKILKIVADVQPEHIPRLAQVNALNVQGVHLPLEDILTAQNVEEELIL